MKKLMTIMALAALTLAAGAQENDTVVIHNPEEPREALPSHVGEGQGWGQ